MVAESITPYECARAHAFEFQVKYSCFFEGDGFCLNQVKKLVQILGIALIEIADVPVKGRLEITNSGSVIKLNKYLSTRNQIITILHEIAHWYLFKTHPEFDKNQLKEWKEHYANSFAYQLCVPFKMRNFLVERLSDCNQVTQGIKLANKYNIPISVFLKIISLQSIENMDIFECIWIIAKHGPNKYTNMDTKLRVHSTLFNSKKFFIPSNQSIENLLSDISWIKNLMDYQERVKECYLKIQTRSIGSKPEYKKEAISVHCSAIKISPNSRDGIPQIILLINPLRA